MALRATHMIPVPPRILAWDAGASSARPRGTRVHAGIDAPVEGRPDMMDVIYLGLIVGFLALSWGLVELCDRL
jgi:hypothetical protein